jgi:hypothetical protein
MVYRKIESEICVVECVCGGTGKRSAPISNIRYTIMPKLNGRAIETPGKPPDKNASDC